MDMHVHLFIDSSVGTVADNFLQKSSATNALLGLKRLQLMLKNGFTTIRVPGDVDYQFAGVDLKHPIGRGDFDGPRMVVAPHALSQLGGHADLNTMRPDSPAIVGTIVKAGTDNVREAVRCEVKYGADWIKITASGGVMSQHDDPRVQGWTDEEIFALVDEAQRVGVKITAHVYGDQAGMTAARAGFDSIEHGTMIQDETIAMMKKNGVVLVPTVYVLDWILEQGIGPGITPNSYEKAVMLSELYKTGNVLNALPKSVQLKAKAALHDIWQAATWRMPSGLWSGASSPMKPNIRGNELPAQGSAIVNDVL